MPILFRLTPKQLWIPGKSEHSTKFENLRSKLIEKYEKFGDDFHGIIFVQRKTTTHVIKHFIEEDGELSAMYTCACISANTESSNPFFKVTKQAAADAVKKFATREINLLIATSVAEEGMDIRTCNVVIRFDPIQTPVSFVQSRGRARLENSEFVLLPSSGPRTVQMFKSAEAAQKRIIHHISTQQLTPEIFEHTDTNRNYLMELNEMLQKYPDYSYTEEYSAGWSCTLRLFKSGKYVQEFTGTEGQKKQAKMEAARLLVPYMKQLIYKRLGE